MENSTIESYINYNPPLGIKARFLLRHFIREKCLTDALALLEELGYTADIAIFVLAFLQGGRHE